MLEYPRAALRLVKLLAAIGLARWEARGLVTAEDRAIWQQVQARRMLAALDIHVSVDGPLPSGGMVVCNHLSYVDILALAAQGPMVFVAKSDVSGWPLIGPLLEASGTILAERGKPLSAGKTGGEIREALSGNRIVVLFPEGTSSDGSQVLPFKPTLLQAALDSDASITPAAIAYQSETGDPGTDICYWGDATFASHIIRLATLRGVSAGLAFGTPEMSAENRKTAARSLHGTISGMLARLHSRLAAIDRPAHDEASLHPISPAR